ncbi:serine hydrolase domain-containing protein [Tellurirhabdus rosea]|uniref:serine hydrolase domain-containing protein n=1 Tax=Tellurirhabdus rosea TaxID=2674997 RepID=UPI002253F1E9|nr:serine hydrolase domain-containing protein [Tellurirhabdus rosea]
MKRLLPFLFLGTTVFAQKAPISNRTTYQPPVFADQNRLQKIQAAFPIVERMFRERAEKAHYPGLAYGIVLDGKLVYAGGIGLANVEKKTPATAKSVFRIASMTKSITAMAILKLRDEGKIRLDEPVATYVPALKTLTPLTADAPTITVRHCMTHAAGFPEDNPWGDRQLADSDAELAKLIGSGLSLSNPPGITFEYSNLGFALLGQIITNVSGKPYQQYITETILKPLGMNDTHWEYTKAPADRLAPGYRWLNNSWVFEPSLHDAGSWGAMGGLMTTIEDFSKYVTLHLDAWPARNESEKGPVKRSSIREMQQPWNFVALNAQARTVGSAPCPLTVGYGYGLNWTKDCRDRVAVGHSGGLPGFGSQWRILPEYGLGVISFANLTYAGTGGVNAAVLDTLIAIGGLKPRQLPVSPILALRKNQLVGLLPDWKGAEASGIFAENFFPDQSADLRRKQVQELYTKVGRIVRVSELVPENQLRGYFLLEGERGKINVFFTLTPENPGLIQQLDFQEVLQK